MYQIGLQRAKYDGFLAFIIPLTMNACTGGIIYYGAVLNQQGELTIGNISSFLLYMIQLIFNFAIIGFVIGNVFKMIGASEKVVKLMQHIPFVNSIGGRKIPDSHCVGEVELKNVTFRYPSKSDVEVLKRVSFKVP